MSKTYAVFLGLAVALGAGTLGATQEPPESPKPVAHLFHGPELVPLPPAAYPVVTLVNREAVQAELKLTDSQKKQQEVILENGRQKLQKARQAAIREFVTSRDAIRQEMETLVHKNLDAGQRDRLNQLLLQAQGPRAFERPDFQKQLEMSRDQVDRVTKIVAAGLTEIETASQVPIDLKPKGQEATLEEVDDYVRGAAFLGARDASRQKIKDVARVDPGSDCRCAQRPPECGLPEDAGPAL